MPRLRALLRISLLVILLAAGSGHVLADHYSGGSITYNCIGGNFYEITLDLYLDCTGAPLTAQSLQLSNDCGVSFSVAGLPLVLTEEVSQVCPVSLGSTTCNGGTLPGIMHYQFVTTLFLSPCNDWSIAWSICCRSATANVQGTPGMYLEATVNNAGGACDQSPQVGDNSIPFVCVNDPVQYNPGFTDPDGNTMSFQLISGRYAAPAPTNVNYQPGSTGGNPITGIALDAATGQLSFTPTVTGNYVVVMQVTTYNALGVPIGTVMRDFLFVVVNCVGDPPVTDGLTNSTSGLITGTGSIEVCDGFPFCVDVPFTDADVGGAVNLVSNAVALLPGATFTVTGTNPAVGRICWNPDPAFSPANILVTATDNACPIPNVASISILVTVVQPPLVPPNAGTNGAIASCSGGPAIALYPLLGGAPDVGGTWTDPMGSVHSGSFNPSNDPFGLYTYSVGNGCQVDQATVNVTSNGGPSPGTNGTLNLCANGATVGLITGLGGSPQAGGTWAGPSPVVGGNYNPVTMLPGNYVYTVLGVAPCPNSSATVVITESAAPNAGTNGTLTLCSNGAAVALSTGLGGAPQAGGAWSGPSPVVGGNYDPATMTAGVYTYTVTGVAPCVNASATVTVTENTATNAGTNGTLTLCSNGAAIAFSTGLGGAPQAGGAWSGPSPVVGGSYDPATMTAGAYTYTVTGVAPCVNASATVTVTENAATNAGVDGTLTVCSNGAAVALSTGLGGAPQAGGAWSGPSPVVGGNYDPATMTAGAYMYTVTGVAPCSNASATVTVTENAATDAGTNGTLTVCSNGAAVALSTGLGGAPQAGGAWSGPSPVVGGNYDPATMTAGVYTYTVTGVAPCVNASATVTVTENAATNAGTNGTLTLCSNGAAVALSTGLGGAPQAGGAWSGPSPVVGGNYDPTTMTAGVYTYTVTGVAPCANASATVTVTENAATNAGLDGTLTICTNGAAVALSTGLGGAPQAGGVWSGPSPVVGGSYDPATMTAGVYTYTVTGVAPCANASATVTVTENAATNAGTNGTLTVCSNGAAVALSTGLGGAPQVGGAWSGPSPVAGGSYDPATMTAGVYTYTVTGVAPCANASATVTVTENAATNAGTNGTLTVCSNGAAVALSTGLGGAPQAGGAWSGPSPVVGGNYDPATMTAGVYTYTVTGVAPCANASATVTVTENAATNAGTNGTLTLCSNGAAVALSTGLGGAPQAGGAWSGPSPVVGGNYDPATMTAGVYTYTVTGVAPCTNASATVTVTENAATNAGVDGTLTVCSNGAPVALSTGLGGAPQAGGAWSGPSLVVGGSYDPATMTAGVYTYTVTGVAPCTNASATVTVTENAATNAGLDGTLTICSNGAAVALSTGLGGAPQAGGVWIGPSPVVGANYDPATMTAGVYTYTVTGVAPCVNASATVTVTENAATNAGANGTLTLCSNGAAVALSTGLGGAPQAGGAWSGPSLVVGGSYDPATMTAGVYTYTVAGVAPCANASATVTVTENAATNAGLDGTLTVCSNGASVALSTGLGGAPQAGGAWSGPSPVVGGNYDPATMTAGVYTYTVTGVAPCANASATVTVTENAATNAGTDGTLTVCSTSAAVALSSGLGGAPQAGGAWSGPSPVVGGNYDPATMTPGAYVYTVTGVAPCANASATVTVNETGSPNAGTDASVTVCSNGATVDLFTQLTGGPDAGGTWSGPSAIVGSTYDPATMNPGVYTYTLAATAPCVGDASTVTVTENPATNAGTDGTLTVCSTSAAVALSSGLSSVPQSGGTWSGPSPVVGGSYDPATMTAGVYTYTVTGVSPCANASAVVTVNENGSPNAGVDASVTVCSNGATVDLFTQLTGGPDAGGTWSGPSAIVGSTYDPTTMNPGVYTYTLAATAPCVSDASTVTVTENLATNAGTDGTLTVCSTSAAVALFTGLGGAPQAGGAWSGPSPVVGGNYDPATMTPGAYVYTVTGVAPCANASGTVTVNETGSPNAGTDASVTVCSSGTTVDLFTQLTGGPDAGGGWSGPSAIVGSTYDPATMNPGVYTYTLAATAPCVGDASAVTVTENAATDAGTDGTLTVCSTSAAVALSSGLGGAPQAGGTWSGPSPVIGGNYDPATMAPGAYVYTVTGVAPCVNASATVTVNETGSPNAGVDASVTVCSSGTTVDLFTQLTGGPDAGGGWSGPSAIVGSTYDPATMNPGVYTYTLAATAPCVGDASTVTVTENAATNAGTDGTLTVCSTSAAVALSSGLGGALQAGGAWSGPSPVVGGNYDPATMAPGAYVYTVTGVAPCANASATVTVNETGSPNAGTDASVTVCSNGATVDLFTQLTGGPDAGGTWSGPSAIVGSTYDPATMTPGVYTYTLAATAPCVGASSTVTVAEEMVLDPGADASLSVCAGAATVDLFETLGGVPSVGGTWQGPGGVVDGMFDPGSDPAGAYIYSLTGSVCPVVSSQVVITVLDGPDAGQDNAVNFCSSNAPFELITQLVGTPDAGGSWTDPSGAAVTSLFDPSSSIGGTYFYTVDGGADCPDDVSALVITVNTAPLAGTDGSLALCASSAPISLFEGLGGTLDAGGAWTAPDGSAHATVVDPAIDPSGTYTYTVLGSAPCANASASVAVLIAQVPNAGEDAVVTLCSSNDPFGMIAALGGTPQPNGLWAGPAGESVPNIFAPSTGDPGTYVYTVTGTAPCGNDQAQLIIAISQAANAGTDAQIMLCENSDTTLVLTQVLNGTPDVTGQWTAPDGSSSDGAFTTAINTPGAYTYTVVPNAPCLAVSASVQVVVVPRPVADIAVDGNDGCTPATVTLTSSYAGSGSCTWILWNGEVVEDCAPVQRVFEQAGVYDVLLVIDAGVGCGADTLDADGLITIYQQPVADFYHLPENVNTLDPLVQFNNASTGADEYLWSFADLATTSTLNPSYTFPAELSADYVVCLVASASSNCADSICKVVEVEDGLVVLVPNAFTPDGSGINDTFKPIVSGVDKRFYRFDIFDRWGQPLFSTEDPNAAWNGLFADGTEVPIGVYVWKLIAKDTYSGARIERIGHVTLVR